VTVSETWPNEIRAEAIAAFFAIAQVFRALGAACYGALIGNGTSQDRPVRRVPGSAPQSCSSAASSSSSSASTPQESHLEAITKPLIATGETPRHRSPVELHPRLTSSRFETRAPGRGRR
jgi:hypothetical protein